MRTYFFVIINTKSEIERILKRIYNIFSPISEEWEKIFGDVEGTNLKFQVLPFESPIVLSDQEIKKSIQRQRRK